MGACWGLHTSTSRIELSAWKSIVVSNLGEIDMEHGVRVWSSSLWLLCVFLDILSASGSVPTAKAWRLASLH